MDNFLFIAFPYLALIVAIGGSIYRYRANGFSYSSLSSQFLETKSLFFGSLPFHVGIITLFLAHLIGFLFPGLVRGMIGSNWYVWETLGLVFAFSALVGIVLLFVRRVTNERLAVVTSKMDIFIELVLIAQIVAGILVAIEYKWGAGWFTSNMAPYLWSIITFSPDISGILALPALIQFHIVAAFLVFLLIPFSRFVHFLVAPFHYISRPFQVVIWTWDRKAIRDTNTPMTPFKPKNN